jgi:SAM-dependent methyltransferase
MKQADQGMRRYYAERAPYYEAVYAKPERARDIAFLKSHLQERFAQRAVLEVACGTGFWTQHIAMSATGVLATDGTPEPLSFARSRTPVERVRFELADAYDLPERLGLFDGAFAGLWFSHVPIGERTRFFASLHARLTKRARVILIDNNRTQLKDFPIAETDAEGNTFQHRTLRDGSVHRVLKNFPGEAELRAALRDCANRIDYRELENFWVLEYEFVGALAL